MRPDWTFDELLAIRRWYRRDRARLLAVLPTRSKRAIKQRAYLMRQAGQL